MNRIFNTALMKRVSSSNSNNNVNNRPAHAAFVHTMLHRRVKERFLEQESKAGERLRSVDDCRQCRHRLISFTAQTSPYFNSTATVNARQQINCFKKPEPF